MTRATSPSELILTSSENGVTTLKMNQPARLNGWTAPMMERLKASLAQAAIDEGCRALILTGADPYYCAGVNLGAAIKLAHPRVLHALIVEHNQALFEAFLVMGFSEEQLSIGFFSFGSAVPVCTPSIVIQANEKAFTYRLDQHKVLGTQEKCDERWRGRVTTLVGDRQDKTREVTGQIYRASQFRDTRWHIGIRESLKRAGISPPTPQGS